MISLSLALGLAGVLILFVVCIVYFISAFSSLADKIKILEEREIKKDREISVLKDSLQILTPKYQLTYFPDDFHKTSLKEVIFMILGHLKLELKYKRGEAATVELNKKAGIPDKVVLEKISTVKQAKF